MQLNYKRLLKVKRCHSRAIKFQDHILASVFLLICSSHEQFTCITCKAYSKLTGQYYWEYKANSECFQYEDFLACLLFCIHLQLPRSEMPCQLAGSLVYLSFVRHVLLLFQCFMNFIGTEVISSRSV